jgi:hypothetical protein
VTWRRQPRPQHASASRYTLVRIASPDVRVCRHVNRHAGRGVTRHVPVVTRYDVSGGPPVTRPRFYLPLQGFVRPGGLVYGSALCLSDPRPHMRTSTAFLVSSPCSPWSKYLPFSAARPFRWTTVQGVTRQPVWMIPRERSNDRDASEAALWPFGGQAWSAVDDFTVLRARRIVVGSDR